MKFMVLLVLGLLAVGESVAAFETAWVVTTDYSSFGRLRSVGGGTPWPVSGDLATIPGDAVARQHDGLVYVVGRGGSNILQVYDPAAGFGLVREFSLGNGLNLQDIAFDAGGEAYISCYDQAVLLRVDVPNETILGSYSTAPYADSDGLPETGWIRAHGEKLFISCQKLDRNNWYAPTGPGQLLVFDMNTESFLAPVDLVGANPYTQIESFVAGGGDPELRLGCAGYFGINDGGIEAVDPVAGVSLGYVVTEAELGGDVTAFASTGVGVVHSLVSNASFVTSLRRYETTGDQLSILSTGNGYVHADVVYDNSFQVFVADRTAGAAGLRVFDTVSGAELTNGVLPTGQPPFMIVLPDADEVSAVPVTPAMGELTLNAPFPNPCNPRSEMRLSGRPSTPVKITVFDLRGRRVGGGLARLDAAGAGVWVFSGLDAQGRALATGVYRVVAQNRAGYAARSITLIK